MLFILSENLPFTLEKLTGKMFTKVMGNNRKIIRMLTF